MTETARTLTFVGVAALSLVVAWFATPPVDITPDQLVKARLGQELFPEFTNPSDPTSIRVVSFDEARAEPRIFAVEFKNGLWTIPSHHSYPADGATRLAKTAASSIGIKRDEFRSASKEDHEELGVVDPLDADSGRLKGRGQRITLSKGETGLVDLIIGKQVRDRPGYYYVRLPSEDSTYVAKIDIDLSTKFADWVETDLLKANRDTFAQIEIDNYSINADGGPAKIVPGEIVKLDRAKSADPWKLEGLDEKTEEVDTTKVNDMVSTLDDLKLVGVRPKPKGLNADLTIDKEFVQNQLELQVLLGDMRSRGFEVGPSREDQTQPRLYSRQGELNVATNEGVVYTLRFGEIFSGDGSEVESGIEADKKKADAAKEDKEKEGEGEKKDEKDATAGKQSSRYLFVSTSFDEKYLGDKPIEPERPAGLPEEPVKKPRKGAVKSKAAPRIRSKKAAGNSKKKAAVEEEADKTEEEPEDGAKSEEEKSDEPKSGEKKVEECGPPSIDDQEKKDDEKKEDEKKDDSPQADAKEGDDAKKEPAADAPAEKAADDAEKPVVTPGDGEAKPKTPEQLKKDYDTLKEKYDADLKAYEAKVKTGEEKVEELNRRFGEWYYVISAESFNKLHLSRKELVKEKAAAADAKPKTGEQPAGDESAPADPTDKPESDAPEESSAKPDEKSKDEKSDDAGEKPEAKAEKEEKP